VNLEARFVFFLGTPNTLVVSDSFTVVFCLFSPLIIKVGPMRSRPLPFYGRSVPCTWWENSFQIRSILRGNVEQDERTG